MACVGDLVSTCGSIAHVQVYSASSPVEIIIDANPKIVATGDTVDFTASVETGNPAYNIRIDYGDDAGKTDYMNSATVPDLSRTYHMAGEYSISAFANSLDLSLTVGLLLY